MLAKDWVTVAAIIVGPILAIQIQKLLDKISEKKKRRVAIFKTLMSTRAARLNKEHVEALNMIDIEFYGHMYFGLKYQTKKEKAVTNSWKNYNDHLNNQASYDKIESWLNAGFELFTKLLYQMSKALGYDFDDVQLKRDCYRPAAHTNIENAQLEVLNGMADLMKLRRPFPIVIMPSIQEMQERINKKNRVMQNKKSTPVSLDEKH